MQYLKGVGPAKAKLFEKLEISTLTDLLHYYPRTYQDRRLNQPPNDYNTNQLTVFKGRVLSSREVPARSVLIFKAVLENEKGRQIECTWFKKRMYGRFRFDPFYQLKKDFKINAEVWVIGRPENRNNFFGDKITVDEYYPVSDPQCALHAGRITPIYSLTEGLTNKQFRQFMHEALQTDLLDKEPEILPPSLLQKRRLLGSAQALKGIHFPGSISELDAAKARLAYEELGCPAYTYSAAYDENEITEVARLSSHVTFNSLNQFHRYEEAARAANPGISFGLRVNPELHSHVQDIYNPCSAGSRLGVKACYLPRPEDMPKGIKGFHCHALCESDAEDTCHLLDAFEAHFSAYLPALEWVNFGGGHLMTRKGYGLDKLKARLKAFRREWPHLRVILEPGAAFVWEAGFLLGRVEDIVDNGNVRTAVMNVSFTAHMPDCLELPYMPKVYGAIHVSAGGNELSTDPAEGEKRIDDYVHPYRLGGNSCLAGDFMGDWLFKDELEPGHLLLFNDMAHYTFVKTCTFNGLRHPSLCFVDTDTDEVLYRRDFGYEDFKRKLS